MAAAIRLAKAVKYENVGTFEFLVEGVDLSAEANFYFLEANPRIQVEHTVTEEISGIDLVKFQIQQALGASLEDLGLNQEKIALPNGIAIQTRINMETMDAKGHNQLKSGILNTFDLPFGKGVRIETLGYKGYQNSPHFDPLLVKLIVHSKSNNFEKVIKKAYRNLSSCNIEGIDTNIPYLQNILLHPIFKKNKFHTRFIAQNLPEILTGNPKPHQQFYFNSTSSIKKKEKKFSETPEGLSAIKAPMPGSVIEIIKNIGDNVQKGEAILIMEAMKIGKCHFSY